MLLNLINPTVYISSFCFLFFVLLYWLFVNELYLRSFFKAKEIRKRERKPKIHSDRTNLNKFKQEKSCKCKFALSLLVNDNNSLVKNIYVFVIPIYQC